MVTREHIISILKSKKECEVSLKNLKALFWDVDGMYEGSQLRAKEITGMPVGGGISDPTFNGLMGREEEEIRKEIMRMSFNITIAEAIIRYVQWDVERKTILQMKYIDHLQGNSWEKISQSLFGITGVKYNKETIRDRCKNTIEYICLQVNKNNAIQRAVMSELCE